MDRIRRKPWTPLLLAALLAASLGSCVEMFLPLKDKTDFAAKPIEGSERLGPDAALYSFAGSHYALGAKTGAELKKMGIYPDKLTREEGRAYAYQWERLEKFDPAMLEYAKGLASAYGGGYAASPERYYLFVTAMKLSFACSALFVDGRLSADGRDYLARNFDFVKGKLALSHFKLDGAREVIGHSFMFGYPFLMDGMNDRGFAVVANMDGIVSTKKGFAFSHPAPGFEYVEALLAVRLLLETCDGVEEAKGLLSSLRISSGGPLTHFLMADASGKSCVVEFDQTERGAPVFIDRSPGTDYQALTNFSLRGSGYRGNMGYLEGPCVRFESLSSAMSAAAPGTVSLGRIWSALQEVRMSPRTRAMNQGLPKNIDTLLRLAYDLDGKEAHYWFAADGFAKEKAIRFFD